MEIPITKTARQYGYIIWNSDNGKSLESSLSGHEKIHVVFNGVYLGEKNIDRRYHRISIGYKHTRKLPVCENMYLISFKKGILNIRTKK